MRFITLALALGVGIVHAQQACVVTPMAKGTVCKCTETVCDSVTPLSLASPTSVAVYESNNATKHFLTRLPDWAIVTSKPDWWTQLTTGILGAGTLTLDVTKQYQRITGFGGAFTDAAAITWNTMTPKIQSLLIDQYFADTGLQYNLGRIPMAGSDFSTHSYSYDDTPFDYSWSNFSVAMDDPVKIPFIQKAIARASRDITLFASPWSPPAWMKWYGSAIQGGLVGNPVAGDKIYDAWANYFVKFVHAYKARGINIWGVTVQNEPITGGGSNTTGVNTTSGAIISTLLGFPETPFWDSNYMSVPTQRDFIKNNLGPILKKAYPDIKIIAWDDGNDKLDQVSGILSDPDAFEYVDGVGVHWYGSFEDRLPQFKKMNDVHNQYLANSGKFILPTEACEGFLPWSRGPWPGEWDRGMTYAYDILNDLNNWAVGWTDWNLMLDMSGGPNHVGNNVDAPILLDTNLKNVFYKQPMYYALGHFSKFLPPNSIRVDLSPDDTVKLFGIQSTAFLTPDFNIVVILVNVGFLDINTWIDNGAGGLILAKTKARSIQTLVFKASQGAKIKGADALDDVNAPPFDTTAPTTSSTSVLSTGVIIAIAISAFLVGVLVTATGICVKRQYAAKQQATVTHIHEAQHTSTVDMQQL